MKNRKLNRLVNIACVPMALVLAPTGYVVSCIAGVFAATGVLLAMTGTETIRQAIRGSKPGWFDS